MKKQWTTYGGASMINEEVIIDSAMSFAEAIDGSAAPLGY